MGERGGVEEGGGGGHEGGGVDVFLHYLLLYTDLLHYVLIF